MPLSGKGMLANFMNVDAAGEDDFNRWYNKEHLAERVAIPGFLEARRYVAIDAPQKYLGTYTTETLDVLDSEAYRHRLANQTPWSLRNLAKFRDATRVCANVSASVGEGRGSALGFVRFRPVEGAGPAAERMREALAALVGLDGVVSAHLIESDPSLSVPLAAEADTSGAGDWYVLIDATGQEAANAAVERLAPTRWSDAGLAHVSTGIYRLLFDLARAELAV